MDPQVFTVADAVSLNIPDEMVVKEMLPADRYLREDRSFFARKSLVDLAHEQGVGPVKDISVFAGGIPEEENMDEMLDEIYRLREP